MPTAGRGARSARPLKRARPRDAVIGEEFADTGHGPRRWVVDPIDGTKNFVRGVPVWATLIALWTATRSSSASSRRRRSAGAGGPPSGPAPHGQAACPSATRLPVSEVDASSSDASLSYSSLDGWRRRGREDAVPRPDPAPAGATRAFGDFWSYMLVAEGAVDIAAEPELALHDMAALVADRHRGRAGGSPPWPAWTARPVATPWPPTASCTTRCSAGSASEGLSGQNRASWSASVATPSSRSSRALRSSPPA